MYNIEVILIIIKLEPGLIMKSNNYGDIKIIEERPGDRTHRRALVMFNLHLLKILVILHLAMYINLMIIISLSCII